MYTSLNIHVEGIADQLYDQTVNVVVCEQLIKGYFVSCSGGPSRKSGSCDQDIQLSKDEMLSAMLVVSSHNIAPVYDSAQSIVVSKYSNST